MVAWCVMMDEEFVHNRMDSIEKKQNPGATNAKENKRPDCLTI